VQRFPRRAAPPAERWELEWRGPGRVCHQQHHRRLPGQSHLIPGEIE
jgi:hypothetical protein